MQQTAPLRDGRTNVYRKEIVMTEEELKQRENEFLMSLGIFCEEAHKVLESKMSDAAKLTWVSIATSCVYLPVRPKGKPRHALSKGHTLTSSADGIKSSDEKEFEERMNAAMRELEQNGYLQILETFPLGFIYKEDEKEIHGLKWKADSPDNDDNKWHRMMSLKHLWYDLRRLFYDIRNPPTTPICEGILNYSRMKRLSAFRTSFPAHKFPLPTKKCP